MNYFNQILHFIKSKKKQIIFALFALFCYIFDNNNSSNLLASAAPLIVAAGASTGSAIGGAAAGTAVTSAAGTAATSAASGTLSAASTAKTAGTATKIASSNTKEKTLNIKNNVQKNSVSQTTNNSNLKNTNPKQNNGVLGINSNSIVSEDESNILDDENKKKPKTKNNFVPSSFDDVDEEEEDVVMDSASKELVSNSGSKMLGCFLVTFFLPFFAVPLIMLSLINPSSSTLSQIDCSKQEGSNCIVEEESGGLLHKLKNLFKYGAYGSNNEVVLKKIEDTYDEIKAEYDFIISLPLLTSSLFSDAEYVKTDVVNNQIVITDEMLERTEYIRDMAELQMIPKFHIYYCAVSSYYNEYTGEYENDYKAQYQYTTEEEEAVEGIPEAECNASTANSTIKKITYYFNEDKYFERLEPSEELDLVYSDFIDADKLLVSKIRNQYNLYKYMNDIDDVAAYEEAPMELQYDNNVNLQSPLKGWISITSPFGMREGTYAGMHNGIDLVSSDKNIYSAGSGVVTRSNVEKEGGNVIEITHTDVNGVQYVTQYAHLSQRLVSLGDTVSANDVIGIMGDTGTMASGVHLHFSMWRKEPREFINPRKLFSSASNY